MKQFDFGKNWISFSRRALTGERVAKARRDFNELFHGIPLEGRTFLDIGFGQGLSLLLAREAGAHVVGNDINESCREALQESSKYLGGNIDDVTVVIGSILEETMLDHIRNLLGERHGFDIVHSWGVLHHTGNMRAALSNTMKLVNDKGYLVLALYNRHVTSPVWKIIKMFYGKSPPLLKNVMIFFFYPIIFIARMIVIRQNPFRQDRGMDFYHNVIDWVGGYPYEYASIDEVRSLVEGCGFRCVKVIPAKVPTGCNEFVFVRNA